MESVILQMLSFICFLPHSPRLVPRLRMSGAGPPFIICLRGLPRNNFTSTFSSTSDDALLYFGEYPVSDSLYCRQLCLISYKTLLVAFKNFTLRFGRENLSTVMQVCGFYLQTAWIIILHAFAYFLKYSALIIDGPIIPAFTNVSS